MIIGVPKEIKIKEHRVAMVPGGVKQLTALGHKVLVEKSAGSGAGISDQAYQQAGAYLCERASEVWGEAELIVKVKEPIAQEFGYLRQGQILYTFLHLAACPELTEVLVTKKVAAIAYETIQTDDGNLPLLKPMSEVAGRIAIQVGATCLEKQHGGKGLLLGGVPGVRRGKVCIIGGGYVGMNAAQMAIGLGAAVTLLDINQERLAYLDAVYGNQISTLMSNPDNIASSVAEADLVVGAVLLTGAKAPTLVTRAMVRAMAPGSALVDVAIDQGGSVETIKATTHDNPTYVEEGVVHYGVTNMPGSVPCTSTYALTNVTLPYAVTIAERGLHAALAQSSALRRGLNTWEGAVTYEAVAQALGYRYQAYPS